MTREARGPLTFNVRQRRAGGPRFDLCLEAIGELQCFAMPKGPSILTGEKRVAVRELCPPKRGGIRTWDHGTYTPEGATTRAQAEQAMASGLADGRLRLHFEGARLRGDYALVKTKRAGAKAQWHLIRLDETPGHPRSKVSGAPAPMRATLSPYPVSGPEWILERRWEGERALAVLTGTGKARLLAPSGRELGSKHLALLQELGALKHAAVIDGVLTAPDLFMAFDLLFLDGRDLCGMPLLARKTRLRRFLPRRKTGRVRVTEHVTADGDAHLAHAREEGWEGVVAKRVDSTYEAGARSHAWLEFRADHLTQAVICGVTGRGLAAFVVGVRDEKDGPLRYAGIAACGVSAPSARALRERLSALVRATAPIETPGLKRLTIRWVEPLVCCDVAFRDWTQDGVMRQPVVVALRVETVTKTTTKTADVSVG